MRVLMLSTDRRIFDAGSVVRQRHIAYGSRFDELHIIVGSLAGNRYPLDTLSDRVTAYPLNWSSSVLWSRDAGKLFSLLSKCDVVVVQDPVETGIPGLIAALCARAPLYVQVHTDIFSEAYKNFSTRNALQARLASMVLKRAARIRVVSEKIKKDVERQHVQVPISVLPIFVDVASLGSLEKKKHPKFGLAALCVGRLEREKNFDIAIRSVLDAREKGHDIGLTIVGSGSQEAVLKQLVSKYHAEGALEFVGHAHDLRAYYAVADVVLLPSEYEGYGMTIVEAIASNTPVIATDVGVARESGAIIAEKRLFSEALIEWIERGPRSAELTQYPYSSFDDYKEKYCADIHASRRPHQP